MPHLIHRHAESLGLSVSASLLAVVTHATAIQWVGALVSLGLFGTAISREVRLWRRPDQKS